MESSSEKEELARKLTGIQQEKKKMELELGLMKEKCSRAFPQSFTVSQLKETREKLEICKENLKRNKSELIAANNLIKELEQQNESLRIDVISTTKLKDEFYKYFEALGSLG
ncbi:hypothetical protein GEMRC1_005816 [Eukaryota sp. GEM-RC1]